MMHGDSKLEQINPGERERENNIDNLNKFPVSNKETNSVTATDDVLS